MKKLIATVTVVGLFAFGPAALAQDEHKRADNPAQGARQAGPGAAAGHAPARASGGQGGGGQGGGGHSGGPSERASGRSQGQGAQAQSPPRQASQRQDTQRQVAPRQAPTERVRSEPAIGRGTSGAVNAPASGSRNIQAQGRTSNTGPARRPGDFAALRGNVQASRHFQAGAYRPPQGFQSRHWGYGDRLPRAYFARNYWLTNFLIYGLLSPPPGLVWVRVGPDALLIDEYSGEVIRVDYGVFY
ncbi:MAG TPA: RcnB family protein [Phenylobacterium sp.]|jgi:Ni/Co efflux regulator RcnB|nr:RcnB family protein [Phenylobacterium sp.]